MPEYIERDATIKLLRSLGNRDYRREKGSIQEAIKMVSYPEYTPTIDAVPVVRCENCKYGYPCGDEIVCYHPEYELAEGKWSYKKDFFCAFGDTKEGADNG